jgi:hypothetical protein
MTAATAPTTGELIARLTRATAARARCAEQVTRFTARATLARTGRARTDWTELRDQARRNRDEWDDVIRGLHTALTRD